MSLRIIYCYAFLMLFLFAGVIIPLTTANKTLQTEPVVNITLDTNESGAFNTYSFEFIPSLTNFERAPGDYELFTLSLSEDVHILTRSNQCILYAREEAGGQMKRLPALITIQDMSNNDQYDFGLTSKELKFMMMWHGTDISQQWDRFKVVCPHHFSFSPQDAPFVVSHEITIDSEESTIDRELTQAYEGLEISTAYQLDTDQGLVMKTSFSITNMQVPARPRSVRFESVLWKQTVFPHLLRVGRLQCLNSLGEDVGYVSLFDPVSDNDFYALISESCTVSLPVDPKKLVEFLNDKSPSDEYLTIKSINGFDKSVDVLVDDISILATQHNHLLLRGVSSTSGTRKMAEFDIITTLNHPEATHMRGSLKLSLFYMDSGVAVPSDDWVVEHCSSSTQHDDDAIDYANTSGQSNTPLQYVLGNTGALPLRMITCMIAFDDVDAAVIALHLQIRDGSTDTVLPWVHAVLGTIPMSNTAYDSLPQTPIALGQQGDPTPFTTYTYTEPQNGQPTYPIVPDSGRYAIKFPVKLHTDVDLYISLGGGTPIFTGFEEGISYCAFDDTPNDHIYFFKIEGHTHTEYQRYAYLGRASPQAQGNSVTKILVCKIMPLHIFSATQPYEYGYASNLPDILVSGVSHPFQQAQLPSQSYEGSQTYYIDKIDYIPQFDPLTHSYRNADSLEEQQVVRDKLMAYIVENGMSQNTIIHTELITSTDDAIRSIPSTVNSRLDDLLVSAPHAFPWTILRLNLYVPEDNVDELFVINNGEFKVAGRIQKVIPPWCFIDSFTCGDLCIEKCRVEYACDVDHQLQQGIFANKCQRGPAPILPSWFNADNIFTHTYPASMRAYLQSPPKVCRVDSKHVLEPKCIQVDDFTGQTIPLPTVISERLCEQTELVPPLPLALPRSLAEGCTLEDLIEANDSDTHAFLPVIACGDPDALQDSNIVDLFPTWAEYSFAYDTYNCDLSSATALRPPSYPTYSTNNVNIALSSCADVHDGQENCCVEVPEESYSALVKVTISSEAPGQGGGGAPNDEVILMRYDATGFADAAPVRRNSGEICRLDWGLIVGSRFFGSVNLDLDTADIEPLLPASLEDTTRVIVDWKQPDLYKLTKVSLQLGDSSSTVPFTLSEVSGRAHIVPNKVAYDLIMQQNPPIDMTSPIEMNVQVEWNDEQTSLPYILSTPIYFIPQCPPIGDTHHGDVSVPFLPSTLCYGNMIHLVTVDPGAVSSEFLVVKMQISSFDPHTPVYFQAEIHRLNNSAPEVYTLAVLTEQNPSEEDEETPVYMESTVPLAFNLDQPTWIAVGIPWSVVYDIESIHVLVHPFISQSNQQHRDVHSALSAKSPDILPQMEGPLQDTIAQFCSCSPASSCSFHFHCAREVRRQMDVSKYDPIGTLMYSVLKSHCYPVFINAEMEFLSEECTPLEPIPSHSVEESCPSSFHCVLPYGTPMWDDDLQQCVCFCLNFYTSLVEGENDDEDEGDALRSCGYCALHEPGMCPPHMEPDEFCRACICRTEQCRSHTVSSLVNLFHGSLIPDTPGTPITSLVASLMQLKTINTHAVDHIYTYHHRELIIYALSQLHLPVGTSLQELLPRVYITPYLTRTPHIIKVVLQFDSPASMGIVLAASDTTASDAPFVHVSSSHFAHLYTSNPLHFISDDQQYPVLCSTSPTAPTGFQCAVPPRFDRGDVRTWTQCMDSSDASELGTRSTHPLCFTMTPGVALPAYACVPAYNPLQFPIVTEVPCHHCQQGTWLDRDGQDHVLTPPKCGATAPVIGGVSLTIGYHAHNNFVNTQIPSPLRVIRDITEEINQIDAIAPIMAGDLLVFKWVYDAKRFNPFNTFSIELEPIYSVDNPLKTPFVLLPTVNAGAQYVTATVPEFEFDTITSVRIVLKLTQAKTVTKTSTWLLRIHPTITTVDCGPSDDIVYDKSTRECACAKSDDITVYQPELQCFPTCVTRICHELPAFGCDPLSPVDICKCHASLDMTDETLCAECNTAATGTNQCRNGIAFPSFDDNQSCDSDCTCFPGWNDTNDNNVTPACSQCNLPCEHENTLAITFTDAYCHRCLCKPGFTGARCGQRVFYVTTDFLQTTQRGQQQQGQNLFTTPETQSHMAPLKTTGKTYKDNKLDTIDPLLRRNIERKLAAEMAVAPHNVQAVQYTRDISADGATTKNTFVFEVFSEQDPSLQSLYDQWNDLRNAQDDSQLKDPLLEDYFGILQPLPDGYDPQCQNSVDTRCPTGEDNLIHVPDEESNPPLPEESDDTSSSNIAIVLGATLGAVAVLFVALIIAILCCKKHQKACFASKESRSRRSNKKGSKTASVELTSGSSTTSTTTTASSDTKSTTLPSAAYDDTEVKAYPLPEGWVPLRDPNGKVYYSHKETLQSTWVHPGKPEGDSDPDANEYGW